jgi:hypothetical protein
MTLAAPVRPTGEYALVGDLATMEVHDLTNEKPRCALASVFDAGRAVVFERDTAEQARDEGFDYCPFCVGAEPDEPAI